jgi:ABC-type molybdate transport system permease subunit
VVGVVVLLLITGQTATGNQTPGPPFAIAGPLAGLSLLASNRDIFAQTMLAIPIMIALTATAVQRISPGLLDQAQAYGAPSWKRGLLAVREARTAVLAAVIVAMGVTITAIGALYVVQGDTGRGCDKSTPATYHATQIACTGDSSLALSALSNFQDSAGEITYADADAMIGIFIILAAGLTFLQQNRTSWIAGGQS